MATYATRNLGVAFDRKLSFRSHISHVRTPAFYHWKRIQTVKSYISKFMLETLVHRFISSQIDFSNSLSKLQTVQNACARFLTGTKQRDSVKQECHNLRWYPVDRHIKSDCRSAVSSIKLSYYWPIPSFAKNLIIFALIMCVYRFTRGLRLAQSVRCPDHVSKHLEIGRLLVPYQICGISCRYLFV